MSGKFSLLAVSATSTTAMSIPAGEDRRTRTSPTTAALRGMLTLLAVFTTIASMSTIPTDFLLNMNNSNHAWYVRSAGFLNSLNVCNLFYGLFQIYFGL